MEMKRDKKQQQMFKKCVRNVDLVTRNINVVDTDPGALTENQVEKLKQKLYKGVVYDEPKGCSNRNQTK